MIEITGIKLEPEYQFAVTEEAVAAILLQYGLKLLSMEVVPSGIENATLFVKTNGGDFVLRVYRRGKKKEEEILLELDFMAFLQKNGIPLPNIIKTTAGTRIASYTDNIATWHSILMERMIGSEPKKYSAGLLKNMAVAHARMHQLGISFLSTQKGALVHFSDGLDAEGLLRHVDMSKITKPEVRELLTGVKNFKVALPKELPHGFNHLDYDQANVLAEGDTLTAILDFEDLRNSPIAVCLGYTLWSVFALTGGAESVREYLKHYQTVRPLQQIELASLKDVMMFRNYIVGCIQLNFLSENHENVTHAVQLGQSIKKLRPEDFIIE